MPTGRITIPTDLDAEELTKELLQRWGGDALRDCDGTNMPESLTSLPVKIYGTYYTTRKDNEWARSHPEEIQQVYVTTDFYTAFEERLAIPLMEHYDREQIKPNTIHDIKRWWEVIDRTIGEAVLASQWRYEEETASVVLEHAEPYHQYSVSFLAFLIWDPVHRYNYLTNDWKGEEHQLTYDVRQPQSQAYAMKKLETYLSSHPEIDVVRFTTFFHQFTLLFNEKAKERYVDWFGYSASVSPYILEQFEKETGIRFRPEMIVDEGYFNNTFRVPSREFQSFLKFQQKEVALLAKKLVDLCHAHGKEVMMFLGDHWIGTEPYGEYFAGIGLDAVVGSVGNGTTLRLISDIEGVRYTEGRLLPYFFPDTFYEGGDPVREAKKNWMTARRAILRKPVDRIGYGGYLKLAAKFPDFVFYVEEVCREFREIYERIGKKEPYSHFRVGILNAWGKLRSWGSHMVAHAIDYQQTYSYAGVLEALSGMPFEVEFLSFDEILREPDRLFACGAVINQGNAFTAESGGSYWENGELTALLRRYVAEGGGLIGIGDPSAASVQGRFFALSDVLGVDKEQGFSMSWDKYNWEEKEHFILEDVRESLNFGEGKKDVYAMEGTSVLALSGRDVQMAANIYGKGRSVYISGLPYSFQNARILYRALFWAAGREEKMLNWFSSNDRTEVHYYPRSGQYCLVNHTDEPQRTTVYLENGDHMEMELRENEIQWRQRL